MSALKLIPWILSASTLPIGARTPVQDGSRIQRFDADPGWESIHNRPHMERRRVHQDFGYSASTQHAGGARGEIGGLITPAAERASYARAVSQSNLATPVRASGRLLVEAGGGNTLLGWFNSKTLGGWRTPNTIALRIQGRGDYFYAYLEYTTNKFRAGADSPQPFGRTNPQNGRLDLERLPVDKALEWTLEYDPSGNEGSGSLSATLGGLKAICHLSAGHIADGAEFDRFGLLNVMKSIDGPGTLWVDDLNVGGVKEEFSSDPKWESIGSRADFKTPEIRFNFDFGYTPTRFAGGTKAGELGGLVYRGDGRQAQTMAAYGDRIGPVAMTQALTASGTAALRWAVSDSSSLLGFYHSRRTFETGSDQTSALPRDFLGIAIEGPSSEGFYLYPVCRIQDEWVYPPMQGQARILPDGKPHRWSLQFLPAASGQPAAIHLTVNGQTTRLIVPDRILNLKGEFDRFGMVTTRVDGNGQRVYFDDLQYTASQPKN